MFKFIFDLITEPLGLPIEWYYEWIILLVIGEIAYRVAYDKVGVLYQSGSISGKSAGSFFSLDNSYCCICGNMGNNIWSDLDWQICYGT